MDNKKDYVGFRQNPEIDILFFYFDMTIPSKREDFKPIEVTAVDSDGQEQILNDFYIKKPSSKSVADFERLIKEEFTKSYPNHQMILKPATVEVTIAISIKKKKFFDVDVDNISKTVLDSIKGTIFEDDGQVTNLICQKTIHPLNLDGFFIAVTELKKDRKGILGDLYLYGEQKD
jgi:Holliday junction resolvase RusA-like endonuclease